MIFSHKTAAQTAMILCCLISTSLVALVTSQPAAATTAGTAPAKKNPAVDLPIANAPDEFRCKPVENSDFDQVNESMSALKKTLNDAFEIKDSCVNTTLTTPANQKNMNVLLDQIRGGVGTLRGQLKNSYVENISMMTTGSVSSAQAYAATSLEQKQAKEAVVLIVGSMKELNQMIQSNPLKIDSSKNCKTQYSGPERLVFGVAEFVDNVSPILIQAVSKIPGLQNLAPLVVGASMVSAAVNQYAQTAQKRIDLQKPENRTAILVNSCQLVKTYLKMQFLKGLRVNPQDEAIRLTQKIQAETNLVSLNLRQPFQINDPKVESRWLRAVDLQNTNYENLKKLNSTMNGDSSDLICQKQHVILGLAESVREVHQTISEAAGQTGSLQEEILRDRIQHEKEAVLRNSISPAQCPRHVKTLYAYTSALNSRSFEILMDFKMLKMSQRPELVKASSNLDYLISFQSLLKKMTTDNLFQQLQSSIAATDSMLQQSEVLKAWFGNAKRFYWPGDTYRNPVMDLMNHYERQFLDLRTSFFQTSGEFESELFKLYQYWHPKTQAMSNRDYMEVFNKSISTSLDILNPIYLDDKNVATTNGRSSPHDRACTSLQSVRNDYLSMMEAWKTLGYFCKMLSPLLNEPEISTALKERCLAVNSLVPNSPNTKKSQVDQLLDPVAVDQARMPQIVRKIQELQCL